jgi:DNA (cytosine-5)-methyltransferase 1
MRPNCIELFAGGGFVRLGLGPSWRVPFANDFSAAKALVYRCNWGKNELKICDIADVTTADLPPGRADLLSMSPPCQDLSVAGKGAGLAGSRSKAFWPAMKLVDGLVAEKRAPWIIALENVVGLRSSHNGADIALVREAFERADYQHVTVVFDAANFVPQSRPRCFIIGVQAELDINIAFYVKKAIEALPTLTTRLIDILDSEPCHARAETEKILSLMQPGHSAKIEEMRRAGHWVARTYKDRQGRFDKDGNKIRAIEIRDDEIAGALLTGGGGASIQGLIAVNGSKTLTRKLTPREYARAQGVPDTYKLPEVAGKAYDLVGDGVCVPLI